MKAEFLQKIVNFLQQILFAIALNLRPTQTLENPNRPLYYIVHNFLNLVGALIFERGFDATADYIWETNNKGKLWKDIKHKYEEAADEE